MNLMPIVPVNPGKKLNFTTREILPVIFPVNIYGTTSQTGNGVLPAEGNALTYEIGLEWEKRITTGAIILKEKGKFTFLAGEGRVQSFLLYRLKSLIFSLKF